MRRNVDQNIQPGIQSKPILIPSCERSYCCCIRYHTVPFKSCDRENSTIQTVEIWSTLCDMGSISHLFCNSTPNFQRKFDKSCPTKSANPVFTASFMLKDEGWKCSTLQCFYSCNFSSVKVCRSKNFSTCNPIKYSHFYTLHLNTPRICGLIQIGLNL